jgi:hypothetical protein
MIPTGEGIAFAFIGVRNDNVRRGSMAYKTSTTFKGMIALQPNLAPIAALAHNLI